MTAISIKGGTSRPRSTSSATGATVTPISPWMRVAEEKGEYDPSNFYVRATDWRGHSDHIGVKLAPDLMAQIMSMIHEESMPDYESPQDFLRDGAVHLLEMRKGLMGTAKFQAQVAAHVKQLAMLEWTEKIKRDSAMWSLMNENIVEAIGVLLDDGAAEQMTTTLDHYEDLIVNIPEPYHTMAMETILNWRKKVPVLDVDT